MAYGRKYYKEFDGYNAATRQTYSVLVDIYEDGFAGTAIEIEKVSASPLQLALDSDGDPLYTAIKKTSATFNIINTGQFDYSEFYTSNAKKYKMMITSTVFNWTGYLVPQAVSFDLATNGEFTLTASDGLHLLQSIDYKANENEMTTLAAFLTDIETKIGLSTFNRTSTVSTEYGDIWNSLIYKGMLVGKTYEEAFEMVLKAIGMQVRYWKITPIISIESALQTASVKCTNEYPELNFLAPIKTAKLTKQITTLPNALKNAMVDDVTDITDRLGGYYTLSNWVIASNNGLPVSPGELQLDAPTEKYKAINVFAKPTNLPYDVSLSGDMHSYFNVRPIRSSKFTLVFSANFGKLGRYAKFVTGEGFKSFPVPVKWSTIRWSLYDSETNRSFRSFNKTSGAWDVVGVPTKATSNEIKVTNPADSDVDVIVEVASPTSIVSKLRFYLFTSDFEASSVPDSYGTQFSRLSIKNIKLDGVEIVSENELYTAVNGAVAVGDNIDVLDYDVDFGSVPVPPLNTSLYYGSAFFDNNLNQLEDIIIGANTVSHEQYLFNTILYTQNEIRKKVYTANVNMLTNVSPFWLKTTLKSDTVMVNACNFDFKTSQLNGEFTEIMPYVYREWTITSESEIGSSDWGGSGGTTGSGGGGGTSIDTSNFVVKTGATDQTIEGIVRPDNLLSNGSVVAKSLAPTDVNEWPQAGSGVDGVVKYDDLTIKRNAQGQLYVTFSGGSDASFGTEVVGQSLQLIIDSVTKTLSLSTHTHNYQPLDADLTAIAALTGTSGLLKKTAADTWTLDTNTYLTAITKTMVESVLTGNITTHTHSQYLLSSSYTAADVLSKLLTVDGSGSGLDADLLRGVAPSNLSVLSATKLANTRTIWGQSFNGEADVNGTVFTNTGVKSRNICIETDNLGNASTASSEINNFNSTLFLQQASSNNIAMCGGGGKVGIGTTDPQYKLDVNGTGRFTESISAVRVISGFDAGYAGSVSCSNWFRSNGTSGWYNETYGAGINSDTSNVVRTYNTNKFKVYNTSVDSIYTLGGVLANGAVVAKSLAPTDVNEWPQAGQNVDGVVRYDNVTIKRNANGQLYAIASGGTTVSWGTEVAGQSVQLIVAAVTKTLALASHTHSQYLTAITKEMVENVLTGNITSHTHNYQPLDADLTAIAALSGTSGLLKKTAADTWVLDTASYLTAITKAMVENVLTGNITTHTHSYLPLSGGNLTGAVTINGSTVWHAGNDGAGSGLDADTVDGFHIGSGSNLGYIPFVEVNGVMEIGKYIDFHSSSPNSVDYSTRLTAVGSSQNELYLPVNNGTLALITDNVASATKLQNTRTIWGQNFNGEGNVSGALSGATTGTFSSTISATTGLFSNLTTNYVPKHTASGLVNSLIYDNGTNVGIGRTDAAYKLDVNGTFRTTGASYLNSTLSVTGASTFTGLLTANGGIGSTTGIFSSYLTANRFYTGYDSGVANSISCSNWFRSNGSSGWYNDTYGAGILSDTANIVRTYSTNKFKVYNTSSDSIYTLGGVLSDGAIVAKYLSASYGVDWPVMTASVQGVAKAGLSLIASAGTLDQRNRHYTTVTSYTDAAARDVTAKIPLGTGNMTSGTLDQIKLDFAPLATTFGLTANVIITQTGAGMGLIVSFREDSGTGRWYVCIYNPTGATVVRDGIYLSISGKQTV